MGNSGGSHQQAGETTQFNWPFLHLSVIRDKNLNLEGNCVASLHGVDLPAYNWRGFMSSLITNAKLLSSAFILNYIPVQSTPHGHTSQSTHLHSNCCCENQLPMVYLRSQK